MEDQRLHIFAVFTIAIRSVYALYLPYQQDDKEEAVGKKDASAAHLKNYFIILFGGTRPRVRLPLWFSAQR
jgi:hypothetical protein